MPRKRKTHKDTWILNHIVTFYLCCALTTTFKNSDQCDLLLVFYVICAFCTFYYVSDVSKVSVLVPGAGLGRLAWEIARLGYICQGNEWSFFMLFSSNFVLNRYIPY